MGHEGPFRSRAFVSIVARTDSWVPERWLHASPRCPFGCSHRACVATRRYGFHLRWPGQEDHPLGTCILLHRPARMRTLEFVGLTSVRPRFSGHRWQAAGHVGPDTDSGHGPRNHAGLYEACRRRDVRRATASTTAGGRRGRATSGWQQCGDGRGGGNIEWRAAVRESGHRVRSRDEAARGVRIRLPFRCR